MTDKNKQVTDPEAVIESALNNTEIFLHKNGKVLLIALLAIVLVVCGYFGYKHLYQAPRSEKASEMMFYAQQQFAIDSFALALNGNGVNDGFLQVADHYGSTPEGNIANYYAGICYLYMGDAQNALVYLKKYSPVDGANAEVINIQCVGLMGDANAEQGNIQEAASLYIKAAKMSENDLTSPYYLKKAGMAYESLTDFNKALEAYTEIKNNFGMSIEARDIDKYIGRIEQQL